MNLVEEKGTALAAETRPLEIPVDNALTISGPTISNSFAQGVTPRWMGPEFSDGVYRQTVFGPVRSLDGNIRSSQRARTVRPAC